MPPQFWLQNPVDAPRYIFTDRFNHARTYGNGKHEGVDMIGTDANGRILQRPWAVLAAQRGEVVDVGFAPQGYGNYVRIRHDWGDETYFTWYGHMDSINAKVGDFVQPGQKLGIAGNTGNSTGTHVHLTLQLIGTGLDGYVVADVVDPEPYLARAKAPFDEATWAADVTIPDNAQIQGGQTFEKVWRVRNTGNTIWNANYSLVFAGDNKMNAPDSVALPQSSVVPGQQIDIRVPLTAPQLPGVHRSTWKLQNAQRQNFEHELYALIQVTAPQQLNEASWVADVTFEDGTIVKPGEQFVKTWRVRNTGTTVWTPQYTLAFFGDERMNGPDSVPIPRNVAPNDTVELSVRLTAPTRPGRYKSSWKLKDNRGVFFEHDQYADIQVAALPVNNRLNEMRFVADVTIPDYTLMQPGQKFTKTWRVRNSGTTTWGAGYVLDFFRDNQMGGPASIPLPRLAPGQMGVVSLELTAPSTPGEHQTTWKGRDPQGTFFEFDLFALIEVQAKDIAPELLDELSWAADVTVPDGSLIRPGQRFSKTWRIRNTGTSTWGAGYNLVFFADDQMNGPSQVPLPPLRPGQTADITVGLTAPSTPGMQRSTWKPRDADGSIFEHELFALVKVEDPAAVFDMLTFMRGDGRLYELRYDWEGGGQQRVQTQTEGERFYHVKNSEWEELWADENFVYRGTDTSPGGNRVYTLTENGKYGSAWVPRRMSLGVPFRRSPRVVFRRKDNGTVITELPHVTWIVLEKVHPKLMLPSGVELSNVAELAGYEDTAGRPAAQPFERYLYAQGYGLVAWEGTNVGKSFLSEAHAPGTIPNNVRETIAWLKR